MKVDVIFHNKILQTIKDYGKILLKRQVSKESLLDESAFADTSSYLSRLHSKSISSEIRID